MAIHGEIQWPPVGRINDRLWKELHGRRQLRPLFPLPLLLCRAPLVEPGPLTSRAAVRTRTQSIYDPRRGVNAVNAGIRGRPAHCYRLVGGPRVEVQGHARAMRRRLYTGIYKRIGLSCIRRYKVL